MYDVSTILVMLAMVVASGTLVRMLPFAVPLPLVQITLGALVAVEANYGVELEPDIFFLLFLPPLLFLDGWRIPKEGLFRDIAVILEMSLGLVIFTVVGVGFLIHWMLPSMPLPVAFALAAIVSPTDPVAVSAIAARVPIPKRLMHILEGESLLNDASGLVCMRFAVAAALTGVFSLADAAMTFLWLALAGLAVGAGLTWTVTLVKAWCSRRFGEETGAQILVSLLTPFAAYLIAEHLHASGILAAVAAGITMSYSEQTGQAMAMTRIRRNAVWDTVQFSLNGIMFVLLGEQLPRIVSGAMTIVAETGDLGLAGLIGSVLAITAALMLLRLAWVWVSLRFTLYRAARHGRTADSPGWRLIVVTSVAGVRGAVTLAGILTLPLTQIDGSPFPSRDLAIFLAAGVVIASLLIASLVLPFLLKGVELPKESFHQRQEDRARASAAGAAIKAIESAKLSLAEHHGDPELHASVAARIMELYRQRAIGFSVDKTEDAETYRRSQEIERRLWLVGLRAERDEIYRTARTRRLSDEIARKLVGEIDLIEARLSDG